MPKLHAGRRFELIFEDPFTYHRQLNAAGESEVMFDFGTMRKKNINPWRWMSQYFAGRPWKCYISGNWHTTLIDYKTPENEVRAIWPSWEFQKWNLNELQDLIENPWSEHVPGMNDYWMGRPNPQQPHKIFVRGIRAGRDHQVRARRRKLTQIQRLYPEVELTIVPATYNFGLQFGAGFTSCSFSPVHSVMQNNGAIFLPNGKAVPWKDIPLYGDEIGELGYEASWVQEDRQNAVLYMIDAARYAAHHWNDPTGPFRLSGRALGDFHNPDMYAEAVSYDRVPGFNASKIKDTDKVLCNACSLWRKCPSYRSEEVCNLPGTESGKLAKLALSRDAGQVVEMLSSVVSKQAERVEKRLDDEQFSENGYDPIIDKMLNNLFRNGTTLAKLLDPSLGRPLVQINTGNASPTQQIAQADTRALGHSVIQQIEATGVKREDITEEMVEKFISENFAPQQELPIVDAEVDDD